MKQISKFLVILLAFFTCSCSKNDDSAQDSLTLGNVNFDFELINDANASLPKYWSVGTDDSQSIGGEQFNISLDNLEKHSGKLSLKMEIHSNPNSKFGAFVNSLPIELFAGKSVEFKGWIKTKGVIAGDPGLWFKVEGAGNNVLDFDDTYARKLNGDNDWKQVSIKMNVSKYATTIYLGGVLSGEGTAWFDDLELYVDGTKIKTD